MQQARRTRMATPVPEMMPIASVVETMKVVKEQCLHCGKFVVFKCKSTRDELRYVYCPACGTQHVQRVCERRHRLTTPAPGDVAAG